MEHEEQDAPNFGVWRPISTIPKDGTAVLVVMVGYEPDVAAWSEDGWILDDEDIVPFDEWSLTHWMPLPPSP